MFQSVEQEIQWLEERFPSSLYLCRGQSELYSSENRVFSTLARSLLVEQRDSLGIQDQEALLRELPSRLGIRELQTLLRVLPSYSPHTQEIEIMADLRHLEEDTNLIDFTRNILVALFFACYENPEEKGQLLFLPIDRGRPAYARDYDRATLFRSRQPGDIRLFQDFHTERNVARAIPQSNVLVHSASGYIDFEKEETHCIPAARKPDILKYLGEQKPSITKSYLLSIIPTLNDLDSRRAKPLESLEDKLGDLVLHRSDLLQQDDDGYIKGKELFFHGHYAKAADHFLAALEKRGAASLDVGFHRFLSSALLRAGRHQAALEALARIPREKWTDEDLFMAALSKQGSGNFSGALADMIEAITKNHFKSNYYIALMRIAEQANRKDISLLAEQSHKKFFYSKHGKDSPILPVE